MNRIILFAALIFFISACSETNEIDEKEYTGRELSYALQQGAEFPVSGEVTFKERGDLSVEVLVSLSGTEGETYHPVHLHNDDISAPDADIAVLLNDLYGKTGESKTIISALADETAFRFDDIEKYYGSVKIHLSAFGDGQDVVLAGGNIGTAVQQNSAGRVAIAVCKSE